MVALESARAPRDDARSAQFEKNEDFTMNFETIQAINYFVPKNAEIQVWLHSRALHQNMHPEGKIPNLARSHFIRSVYKNYIAYK